MKQDIIDINESTINSFVKSIRPEAPEVRKQVDIGYDYNGSTAILYQTRALFDNPDKMINIEFAKMRFYKSRQEWNLYWKRANGNWELYEPFTVSSHLDQMLNVIKEDKHGCFFG